MKSEGLSPLQQQNKQRNQKIASILTLLITFSAKIEKIKEKLCGFSSKEFSPQSVFEALDLTSKGYLDLYDVREFLSNDRINDQDIFKLFLRFGSNSSQPRLTYHGYLQLLRPHFSSQLSRDLLIRDTLTKNVSASDKVVRQSQQTVLLLLNELILLNCISVAEHEEMKTALMEEYMLNEVELLEITGLSSSKAHLQTIFEFIDYNSDFEVHEEEIKFLLAYLRVPEYKLSEESVIAALLLPTRLSFESNSRKTVTKMGYGSKDLSRVHANYDKICIGRNDLLSSTQKWSFLNYVHPNSYKHPKIVKAKYPERDNKEDRVGNQHEELDVYNDQKMKNSIKQFKKVQAEKLEESVVQPSNIYKSQVPQKLITASQIPLNTPILQQFMRESNIKTNMGQYSPARPHQLDIMMEESVNSHMSESQAFERVSREKPNTMKIPQQRQFQQIQQRKQVIKEESEWKPNMQVSNKLGQSGGILNQFMKAGFS